MAARHRHHHIKAPNPTWLVTKATPPAPSRDAAKKLAPPAYSPFLLTPSEWRKVRQNGKKSKAHGGRQNHPGRCGDVPASPRIGCMGQVKGERRRCSSACGPGPRGSESESESGYAGGRLTGLVMGLFGRRRGMKSRACSKVRDVPSDSSPSTGSTWDPPLPVPAVRLPAREDSTPSLWERRRGGVMALEGLRLT